MVDATIPALLQKNADLFLSYEAWSNIQTLLVAGRTDDPASFDASGTKVGPLGYYPFVNVNGQTVYVPCIARQIVLAGSGGLTAAGFQALAVAVQAEIIPATTEILLRTAPGQPLKRGSPYLIAPRKTVDRDVMAGSEYAEWIDCLSSTGMERKIAFSDIQKQFGGVIDPTRPPYNVKYDFKKALGISLVSGSNRITCDTAAFTIADIGKLICASGGSSQGPLIGYIGQIEDPRNLRVFTALNFTTPANSTITTDRTAKPNGEEVIWGTDCTLGMQAALDAAEPTSRFGIGAVVVIGGIALVTRAQFGSISVVGLADSGCGLACLPLAGSQNPFFCDKAGGAYPAYASLRPDAYTIKNLTLYCQRFTNYFTSFRNGFEVRGGGFEAFRRGAPYARIENIDVYEAQWNNIVTQGAFAGQFNSIRSFGAAQVGMRMGFWDLNGINWHAEANGCCGIFSVMPGANVNTVRCAFNGVEGGNPGNTGGLRPHEYGSNYVEAGFGNTVSNLRMQESYTHSLCFTGSDPLNASNNGGNKNAFFIGTFDDTADMVPGQARPNTNLPGVRAMVYMKGGTCVNNTVNLVTGSGQVKPTNYATNAYWDTGNPSGNHVTFSTPGITNAAADWYPGGTVSGQSYSTPATARGPWGTSSDSSIGTRQNVVTINGATAP